MTRMWTRCFDHCVIFGLAAVLVAIAVTQTASGQFGRSSLRALAEPDIMRRDVPYLVDQLDLDRTQRVLFETMIDEYERTIHSRINELQSQVMQNSSAVMGQVRERRRELRTHARERMEQVREELREAGIERGSSEAREIMRERMAEMRDEMMDVEQLLPDTPEFHNLVDTIEDAVDSWQREKRQLREELLTDLELQLADHQLENWQDVRRGLRREHALSASELSGEGVDLVRIVDSLDLDDSFRRSIASTLQEYQVTLHEALQSRDEQVERGRVELIDVLRTQDVERGMELIERELRRREAVRDINDTYRELLARELPDELGEKLRQSALESGYERVFNPTIAQRTFMEARRLDDLSEDVIEQMKAFEQEYRAELNRRNERLVRLTREHEAEQIRDNIERMAGMLISGSRRAANRLNRGRGDNPLESAYRERREIERRYVSMLEDVLTEDQFASLPAAQQRAEREERAQRMRERGRRIRNRDRERDQPSN